MMPPMSKNLPKSFDSPVLCVQGISKTFPGVKALNSIDFSLYPGTVTALVGENGAGKSTLVKVLTGVYQPDAGGNILLDGKTVQIPNAHKAALAGIAAIHQETVLFDDLSVAENVFLGHQPRNAIGLLDWNAIRSGADAVLAQIGADINPDSRLRDLSIGQRHMVAIARALSVDARIVIMDEPTASLSHKEVEDLYAIVKRLKEDGKSILFISHKFEDVYAVADRYTVLRDGEISGNGEIADVTRDDLIQMMIGRTVDQVFPKEDVEIGDTVLNVEEFTHPTEFADISFDLKQGEILGFYGLVGSGRSEMMQALFGISNFHSGRLALDGKECLIKHPEDAIEAGLVYIPEERAIQGAILPMPITQNIGLASLGKTTRCGLLDATKEFQVARHYSERLDIRAASLSQLVETLSGGNQQKVVIGKWLATEPKVLILDEPTKGIDIGSKSPVHAFMSELAGERLGLIMVSSDLPEVIGMSDRVIVMREGRMAGEFSGDDLRPDLLVRAATGNQEV